MLLQGHIGMRLIAQPVNIRNNLVDLVQVQGFSASSQPRWSDHHIESATPGHQYKIGFNNKQKTCTSLHHGAFKKDRFAPYWYLPHSCAKVSGFPPCLQIQLPPAGWQLSSEKRIVSKTDKSQKSTSVSFLRRVSALRELSEGTLEVLDSTHPPISFGPEARLMLIGPLSFSWEEENWNIFFYL